MKILCAVDDSDYSRWVIQGVGTLFRAALKEIVLLHVIDSRRLPREKHAAGHRQAWSGLSQRMQQSGMKLLHEYSERITMAKGQGGTAPLPEIKPVLVKGHVSDTIIQWAEKTKADCIAIGSRGISDVPGYLLGSVSRKVVTHAPSSVFMVKQPVTFPLPTLVAVDGSKSSKWVARQVQAWLNPEDVSLTLVSVVPDRLTDLAPEVLGKRQIQALLKPVRQSMRNLLKDYREKFLKAGYEVKTACLEGNPADQIIRAIPRHHIQLVCVGSKGLSGVERFNLGSVSEWVSTYAPAAVLVARH